VGLSSGDLRQIALGDIFAAQNNPFIMAGRQPKQLSAEGSEQSTTGKPLSMISLKPVNLSQNGFQDGGSLISMGLNGAIGLGGSQLNILA
jgi:hypothetical protein